MIDLIKSFLMPSQLIMAILMVVVILTLANRGRRQRNILLIIGVGSYALFSTGIVASALMAPLEYRFPAVREVENFPSADVIVVLAAYASNDDLVPLSSQANSSSTFRLIEAFHLYSARPKCTIVISGHERDVGVLAKQLNRLGVPNEKILVETSSAHTYQSALTLSPMLKSKSFFLVTSAGHMPRAVGVFRALGLHPAPAPTDYKMPKDLRNAAIIPNAKYLSISDQAVREYGGIVLYRLSGRIESLVDAGF